MKESKGRIAVFCSASYTIDPKYNAVAREFVRAAASAGYGIVSGGTVKGTMGVICDELILCGGTHVGVLPRFMKGLDHEGMSDTIWVDTMSQRKELMRKDTVAAVALPGGIGTLDELMETLTLKKLGQYDGQVIVINCDGFYDPLAALMDYYVETEMLDPQSRKLLRFAADVDEVMKMLEEGE